MNGGHFFLSLISRFVTHFLGPYWKSGLQGALFTPFRRRIDRVFDAGLTLFRRCLDPIYSAILSLISRFVTHFLAPY